MNDNEKRQIRKSIMYKMISLGTSVYLDDDDEFVINLLVCKDCRALWNKSRTECFYCGTENYHIYQCTNCGEKYSITSRGDKCSTEGCGGKLIKRCLNPSCISNTNTRLKGFVTDLGGVFNIKKSGSSLNEMRCKKCGSYTSMFISIKAQILFEEITEHHSVENVLYIRKNSENDFDAKYNGEEYKKEGISDILKKVFEFSDENFISEDTTE